MKKIGEVARQLSKFDSGKRRSERLKPWLKLGLQEVKRKTNFAIEWKGGKAARSRKLIQFVWKPLPSFLSSLRDDCFLPLGKRRKIHGFFEIGSGRRGGKSNSSFPE